MSSRNLSLSVMLILIDVIIQFLLFDLIFIYSFILLIIILYINVKSIIMRRIFKLNPLASYSYAASTSAICIFAAFQSMIFHGGMFKPEISYFIIYIARPDVLEGYSGVFSTFYIIPGVLWFFSIVFLKFDKKLYVPMIMAAFMICIYIFNMELFAKFFIFITVITSISFYIPLILPKFFPDK